MASAKEVAVLMASEGEYEKKISWLKKAIVSVTKQKQELEAQNIQLQNDLSALRQENTLIQEENLKLHRRLSTLENEVEQERKKSPGFGRSMLKGLSSLVLKTEDHLSGAAASGFFGKNQMDMSHNLSLSTTDVESILTENRNLLVQVYNLKSECEDYKKAAEKDLENQQVELERVGKEAEELRSLLKDTTHICDTLNADRNRLKAFTMFCNHVLSISSPICDFTDPATCVAPPRKGSQEPLSYVLRLTISLPVCAGTSIGGATALPDNVVQELVQRALETSCNHVSTLLSGVSVLISALSGTLPHLQRATVGYLRCLSNRLDILLDAHNMAKVKLLHVLNQVRNLLFGAAQDNADQTPASGFELWSIQRDFLVDFCGWIEMMHNHIPLLVDSCVAYLPCGQTYPRRVSSAAPSGEGVIERDVFVEEMARSASTCLSWMGGCLEGMVALLKEPVGTWSTLAAAAAAESQPARAEASTSFAPVRQAQTQWVMMLQLLWWESTTRMTELTAGALTLAVALEEIAQVGSSAEVRNSLQYIATCLRSFDGERREQGQAGEHKPGPPSIGALRDGHQANNAGGGDNKVHELSSNPFLLSPAFLAHSDEELLHALAAADRAAVCYATQMNSTLLELAEKEDAMLALEDELQKARTQLTQVEAESQRARVVFEEQVKVLSEQLVGYTSSAV